MKRFFTLSVAAVTMLAAVAASPIHKAQAGVKTNPIVATKSHLEAKKAPKAKAPKQLIRFNHSAQAPAKAAPEISEYEPLWTDVFGFITSGSEAAPVEITLDDDSNIPESAIGEANYGFGGDALYYAGAGQLMIQFADEDGWLWTPDVQGHSVVYVEFEVKIANTTAESDEVSVLSVANGSLVTRYDIPITSEWTSVKKVFDLTELSASTDAYMQIYANDGADIIIKDFNAEVAEVESEPLETPNVTMILKDDNTIEVAWDAVEGANYYEIAAECIIPVKAGETVDIINADFSSIESTGTMEKPDELDEITAYFPEMPEAQVIVPATIPGAIAMTDNYWYAMFGYYASIQTPSMNLAVAKDGKITGSIEAAANLTSDAELKVLLYAYQEAETEDEEDDYAKVDEFSVPVTSEFQKFDFTLTGANDDCLVIIWLDGADYEIDGTLFVRSLKLSIEAAADDEITVGAGTASIDLVEDEEEGELEDMAPRKEAAAQSETSVILPGYAKAGATYQAVVVAYTLSSDYEVLSESEPSEPATIAIPAGIEDVVADIEIGEVRYYDLRGIRIDRPASGSIAIRVAGGKASKVYVK